MNRFFAIVGGCIVLVLAALFTAPALIDWSRYRANFEDEASRLLGRPVRVGEHVRVQLLPSPYVSFENVRIADASGHFDTPLLRADNFHMQLAIGALLTGSLVAQDIGMTGPSLRLSIGPDGRGNWLGLGGSRATTSAASDLQGLALNAVHIEHGTVELVGAAGWHSRFTDISGDLDAPSLSGPYRFKGSLANAGKPVDVRLAAGRDEPGGKTRLKVTWHDMASGAANYSLDGAIEGIDASPVLTGTVTAQLLQTPGASGGLGIDLKAGLEATPDRAKLHDMELVFDSGARPQRLMGSAVLDWRDASASQADLSAVWLDLDKIAGVAPTAGPFATIRKLVERLAGASVLPDQSHIRLKIGEATIGGGTVNDLALAGLSGGHGLTVESLTGRLPGLSRVDLSGELGTEGEGRFSGGIRLWGADLAGLVNWAVPGAGLPAKGSASTYLIDSAISVEPAHLHADRLRLEISGTSVTGAITYAGNEPRSLSVSLDSGRLDVARLLDAPIAGAALSAMLTTPDPGGKPNANDGFSGMRDAMAGETHLDLRIGRLIMAQGALKDVSARLDRSNGRLDIPSIDLSTDGGIALHIEGALQNKDERGQGQLRLTLDAPDAKSITEVVKLGGAGDLPANAVSVLTALTPLRLAGTLQLGASDTASERLQMDGSAKGSRLSLAAERDGADADWLSTRLDLAAELSNTDDGKLLSQVAEALGAAVAMPQAAAPGRLTLRLSGVPQESMVTSARLESQPVNARFDGRSVLGGNDGLGLDGAVDVEAASGAAAMALTRMDRIFPAANEPLKLTARISRENGVVTLAEGQASIAGETLTGEARLDSGAQPPKFSASLNAGTLVFNRLLGGLVPARATGEGTAALVSIWPATPFDFTPLAGFEANITASANRAVLTNGISVTGAKLTLASTPAGLDIALTEGRMAGGDATGRARLSKEVAGAGLKLEGALTGAGLDSLSSATAGLPRPHGRLDLSLHLDGHGVSPRDVAASATGAGDFVISEGSIAGMSPLGVDAVARDLLADAALKIVESDLKLRLEKARQLSPFPMLGAHGAITIADGAARFDRLKVQSSKAELEVANRIDLSTLGLASTWSLTPKSPEVAAPALAPVQFTFEGPLTSFASVPPSIDVAALARDLVSRKVLGGPEQIAGIWPVTPPPVAAPQTAQAVAAAPAAPPPVNAPTAAPVLPVAPVAQAVVVAAASASPDPTIDPAAPAAASNLAVPAPKAAPAARAKKKKANWAAALLQNLFGN